MRSARLMAARAALLAGAWGLLFGGGCFRPNILSGGFKCSATGTCPDNFTCVGGLCVSAGAAGGAGGAGGAAGAGGHPGTGGVDAGRVCLPAVDAMSCAAGGAVDAGGTCDPVCNTGCATCDEKCSVNSAGAFTCNPPIDTGAAAPALFGTCVARMVGSGQQTDNCAPGQICLAQTTCQYECYQFCHGDADCPGSTCSRDLGNGHLGCEVPPADCDPIKLSAGASNGCPGGNLSSCYLSAQTETTVCDCQTLGQTGKLGSSCVRSRDCFPGLVCANEGQGLLCYQICRLGSDGGAGAAQVDAGEQACNTLCLPLLLPNGTASKTYGVCLY